MKASTEQNLVMSEDHQTEWKSSWRDEYLKWICGFANAHGGVLVIGRDDEGKAVGIDDIPRLLEEIPNKIRNILGIVASINLIHADDHDIIEITVDAYPSPISYKGEYYIRSGSTLQKLHGPSLEQFLLKNVAFTGIAYLTLRLLLSKAAGTHFSSLLRKLLAVGAWTMPSFRIHRKPFSQILS